MAASEWQGPRLMGDSGGRSLSKVSAYGELSCGGIGETEKMRNSEGCSFQS